MSLLQMIAGWWHPSSPSPGMWLQWVWLLSSMMVSNDAFLAYSSVPCGVSYRVGPCPTSTAAQKTTEGGGVRDKVMTRVRKMQENCSVFMRERGKDNVKEGIADNDMNLPDIGAVQKKTKKRKRVRGSMKPHFQIPSVPNEVDSTAIQRKATLTTVTEPYIHAQPIYPDTVNVLSSNGKVAVPEPMPTAELKNCTLSAARRSLQSATTMSQKEKGEIKREEADNQKELSYSMTNYVGKGHSGLVEMGTLESTGEEEVIELEKEPEVPLHGQHRQVTPHSGAAKLDGSISVSADLDELKLFTKREGLEFVTTEYPTPPDGMRDMTAPTRAKCQENQRIVSYAVENNMAVDLSTMKVVDLPNDSNKKVAVTFPILSATRCKMLKLPDPRITPDELVSALELANERGELRDWLLVNRLHGGNRAVGVLCHLRLKAQSKLNKKEAWRLFNLCKAVMAAESSITGPLKQCLKDAEKRIAPHIGSNLVSNYCGANDPADVTATFLVLKAVVAEWENRYLDLTEETSATMSDIFENEEFTTTQFSKDRTEEILMAVRAMSVSFARESHLMGILTPEARFLELALPMNSTNEVREEAFLRFCPKEGITKDELVLRLRSLCAVIEGMPTYSYGRLLVAIEGVYEALTSGTPAEYNVYRNNLLGPLQFPLYDVSMGEEWQLQLRVMLNRARLDFPMKNQDSNDDEDLSRIFEVLSPFSKNKKLGNEVSDVDWLDLLSKNGLAKECEEKYWKNLEEDIATEHLAEDDHATGASWKVMDVQEGGGCMADSWKNMFLEALEREGVDEHAELEDPEELLSDDEVEDTDVDGYYSGASLKV
eukprot:343777_1